MKILICHNRRSHLRGGGLRDFLDGALESVEMDICLGKDKILVKGDMSKFWLTGVVIPLSSVGVNPDICSGECGYTNQEFEIKISVFLKLQIKYHFLKLINLEKWHLRN